jgi:hypothetical protein
MIKKNVVTGKPKYISKRVDDLMKMGWTIAKSHTHPDGSRTYVLEQDLPDLSDNKPNTPPPENMAKGGKAKKQPSW